MAIRNLILIRSTHTTEKDLAAMIPRILISPHYFPIYKHLYLLRVFF